MSKLYVCQNELLNHDCIDFKKDHCDGCNIFQAYNRGYKDGKAYIETYSSKNVWIVTIHDSEGNQSRITRFVGSVDQLKEHMLTLVDDDCQGDKKEYLDFKTDCVEDIQECGNDVYYAVVCYDWYHVDITAQLLSSVE